MHVVVVEPHPDDAFLSLGWHLQSIWEEEQKTIITVYADGKRSKEAKAYAESVGAESIVIGLEESKLNSTGPIRRIKELDEVYRDLDFDWLILPLGLQHIDHMRVARSKWYGKNTEICGWYLDTPYMTKLMNQESLRSKVQDKKIVSMVFPPKKKWAKKTIEIFKSQSKFFHYNPLWEHKLPEIIVR